MSRPVLRPRTSHAEAAASLKANPGEWQQIGSYRTSKVAEDLVRRIRTGRATRDYLPAGAFEACTEIQGDDTAVIARHIGGAS